MASAEPSDAPREPMQVINGARKPRILLAASGSVAAIKFGNLCSCFSDWAEVKAVATQAALHFIDQASLPKDLVLYTDEHEWSTWSKIGDTVLHIELRRWADIMVIAPLSANTLGKIAGGLCDNLLTSIIRAWDYEKPVFVAPAMNTFMWTNPFTERHLMAIDELGITLIPPVSKRLACGDYGNGAMAEPSLIFSTVRLFLESQPIAGDDDDDDVEEVPPQSVPKKKFPTRAKKRPWTGDEEEALAMAWVQISTCPRVGNEQGKDGFWKRILEHFAKNINGTTRTHHALGTKWRDMNALISVFNGFYHQSSRLWESGCNDLDIYKNAMASFEKKHGKPFTHQRAWEVVRQQTKWLEQKCVQDEQSSHFDKRRKSTESGHYESASNEPFDTVLPNLDDGPSPALDTRQRKGKKVASEALSKGSVADMVQEYTMKKTSLLEENARKQQELLDKHLQERDQRVEYLKDKAMYRDHKFYNSPHDHITDPRMLKWTLDRKREVGAKHNWPWLWGDY